MGRTELLLGLLVGLCVPISLAAQDHQLTVYTAPAGSVVKSMRSNTWGTISANLTNKTDQERDLEVSVSFDARPHVQFARRVWAPARSEQKLQIPAFAPAIKRYPEPLFELPSEFQTDLDNLVLSEDIRRAFRFKLLFSVEFAVADRIENGVISDALRNVFKEKENALSEKAAVAAAKTSSTWRIRDADKVYVVEKEGDALNIYTSRGHPLSEKATVLTDEEAGTWLITDEKKSYLIQREGNRLKIYDQKIRQVPHDVILLDEEGRQLFRTPGLGSGARDKLITGLIRDAKDVVPTAIAIRKASGLSRRMNFSRPEVMPDNTFGFQGLDALVLAHSDMKIDPAQAQSLRRWVICGGRLWVMLDKVNFDELQMLLRDDWTIQIIDRVELNRFTLEGAESSVEVEVEEPIEMVRVVAKDMEVLHRVKGYPASLRRTIGRGTILITTLGPRGWVKPGPIEPIEVRAEVPPDEATLQRVTELIAKPPEMDPTAPMKELAKWFNRRVPWLRNPENPFRIKVGEQPALGNKEKQTFREQQAYIEKQVGYSIIGRSRILAVLGIFCAVVVLSGLWLSSRRQLEHIGWVGVCASVLATLVFLGMGFRKRQETPLTLVTGSFVHVLPDQHAAITTGIMGLYNPGDKRDDPIEATRGGLVWPDAVLEKKSNVRMFWTDIDKWQWQNLAFRSDDVQIAQYRSVDDLNTSAVASFGAEGMVGKISPGPFAKLEDALLATYHGSLSMQVTDDGEFTARAKDVLPPGRYVQGAILKTTQQRRQTQYQELLEEYEYPRVPTLLGWAKQWDVGLELIKDELTKDAAQHHQSVLVAIPLKFQRAVSGTKVTIPSAMIGFQSRRGTSQRRLGLIYVNRKWVGTMNAGGTYQFAYTLPEQILPLRVEEVVLTTNLTVDRKYEIDEVRGEELIPLHSDNQAFGSKKLLLTPPPQPDARGQIVLELRIIDPPGGSYLTQWKLSQLDMTIRGVVMETETATAQADTNEDREVPK